MAPTHNNNVKIYNVFFRKNIFFICRHTSQHTMVLLSRYYTARGGTTMNYAKNVVISIFMHIFFQKKYLGSTRYILYVLYFLYTRASR